jgi:histidyl-tRNA synthetase
MAGERIQVPRGTFDLLPDDLAQREQVEQAARRVLEPAGYRRLETPTFEATELFARGVGASTDIVQKEMYTFDDGGGRSVTLRPEGTAPVCRAYLEHGMHRLAQPVKVWYLGRFYRHEAPQAGRYREFWQVGAEAVGSADPAVDAELIVLLADLLEELQVRDVVLSLSSLGSPDARSVYRERLAAHLRANEGRLSGEVRERIDLNPLRAFDSDHPGTQEVMRDAPMLLDGLDDADAEHFARVRGLLDDAGVAYRVDPTLVRGLDYYARTVFEFSSGALGAQSGVGGGGRYDGLVEQLGGDPTPGCGWAAGVERMLLAAGGRPVPALPIDLFVAYAKEDMRPEAFRLAAQARRSGLSAQLELAGRSLKGQLKQAGRLHARWAAILGDEGASLRDMESGDQRVMAPGDVVAAVQRGERL